jgi:hypothetical protein
MFKLGRITCCTVCNNEDENFEKVLGLSREFGVTFCPINTPGPFPLPPVGASQKDIKNPPRKKGWLVGGHYQIFNSLSLEYIVRNHLEKEKTYYIGSSIYGANSIVLSTMARFVKDIYKEIKL